VSANLTLTPAAFRVGETKPVIDSRPASSPPAGYRFPREVIALSVRWYLRYGLSYRDVEELLAERGIVVDHVTIYRWVQTFTAEFIHAARPTRHTTGDRWFVDETYVKVAGRWTYDRGAAPRSACFGQAQRNRARWSTAGSLRRPGRDRPGRLGSHRGPSR
jgi:hypothetical protein